MKQRQQTLQLILHCSATPGGRDFTVADIDRWHRQRGFECIGYHYVIYRDGSIHRGRPENAVGAHCKGYNNTSIGICYIGGVSPSPAGGGWVGADTRTPEQKTALRRLLTELMARYPRATIHGHYEFARKACPSFPVSEYDDLNANRK